MSTFKRPILLWITSRSRSSLVSKIFINHGVWWGNTIAKEAFLVDGAESSYITYENQDIKTLLHDYKTRYWHKVHLTPVSPQWNIEFENDLAAFLPTNKTWMMKTGVEYFNAFKDMNPYNIFIKRNAEDVAQSLCNKRPDANYKEALEVAEWRFNYMDGLRHQHGGVVVDTDRIVHGDFSQVQEAIEYCGLRYEEESANGAVL